MACLKIDGAEERILALLSVAYDRPVAPWVLTNLRNASRALAKEELCQAAIHVAFSGLPSLEDEDAPRRLFLADHLLADGLDEGEMLKALDLLPQAVAVKQWREWAKYGGRSSAVAEAGGMFRKEGAGVLKSIPVVVIHRIEGNSARLKEGVKSMRRMQKNHKILAKQKSL